MIKCSRALIIDQQKGHIQWECQAFPASANIVIAKFCSGSRGTSPGDSEWFWRSLRFQMMT